MLEKKRTDREIRNMARYAIQAAPKEIARALTHNAEHPDARPMDCEYWRVAAFFSRKILRAFRRHKEIDPRWVEVILDGDALPEY
ncbi:MAG: hypothetical protein ACYC35_28020 [Pirellulales bacterium]